MRWVSAAGARPHRCAFLPQLGSHHPRGYFDSGVVFFGDRIYVSVVAVEMMAHKLGMVPMAAFAEQVRRVAQLEAEVTDLEGQVADAQKFRESAQHAFGQLGGNKIPARKPGRPKAAA